MNEQMKYNHIQLANDKISCFFLQLSLRKLADATAISSTY